MPESVRSELMVVVYTHMGYTFTFYDCEQIKYHNRKLEMKYYGFSGKTTLKANDIAMITKHKGVINPNVKKK